MNWETLLSLGDSITFGARSYLAYPEICGSLLEKSMRKNWHVINHATNGFTTMDLVRSLNPQLQNYKQSYPSLITVMIGTNDIKTKVNPADFEIAYRQLIVKMKLMSVNNNIVLLKIPRFTNDVFYPYHFEMNDAVKNFNELIYQMGAEAGLRVFEFDFADDDFYDGVHLNAKGSSTAGKQLCQFILKDKGIESSTALS